MRGLAIVVPFLLSCSSCKLDAYGRGSGGESSSSGEPSSSTSAPTDGGTSTTEVATGSATTSSDGTATGSSSEGSGTTGIVLACGEAPEAEQGSCEGDQSCDECSSARCEFDCTSPIGMDPKCEARTMTCAEGVPCVVECFGPQTCRNAVVDCPSQHACTVRCSGDGACADMQISCGAGPCTVACNNHENACFSLGFNCNTNNGTVTCNTEQNEDHPPEVVEWGGSECECSIADECSSRGG